MSEYQEGQISDSGSQASQRQTKIVWKSRKIRRTSRQHSERPSGFVSSNYRTQKCDFFNKGHCIKGDQCTYRHDFIPDTVKKICKFYLSGACTKENCLYSHNTKMYPCRFYHIDKACQLGINCRFSHQPIPPDFYDQYMKDNKDHILKLYKEKRLPTQTLIEYIKEDLPRKDLPPPPIALSPPPEPLNKQTQSQLPTLPKKDPRLKLLKQAPAVSPIAQKALAKTVPQDPRLKRQEKEQEAMEQDNETFYKYIKQFLCSYY